MKIIWYEDMKTNTTKIIQETTDFLKYQLSSNQLEQLENYLTFDNLKQVGFPGGENGDSPMGKNFFRKGIVGDWKNYFDGKMVLSWNEWIADHLEGTDIVLPNHQITRSFFC